MENKKVIVITDEHNYDQVLATLIVDSKVNENNLLSEFDAIRSKKEVGLTVSDLLESIDIEYVELPHNWLSA